MPTIFELKHATSSNPDRTNRYAWTTYQSAIDPTLQGVRYTFWKVCEDTSQVELSNSMCLTLRKRLKQEHEGRLKEHKAFFSYAVKTASEYRADGYPRQTEQDKVRLEEVNAIRADNRRIVHDHDWLCVRTAYSIIGHKLDLPDAEVCLEIPKELDVEQALISLY